MNLDFTFKFIGLGSDLIGPTIMDDLDPIQLEQILIMSGPKIGSYQILAQP